MSPDAPFPRPAPGPVVAGAGGVPIATWDLGGSGPPAVLTHGTGFSAWMWLGAAAELTRTHRVWGIDLRGHGASGPSAGRTYRDWSVFAADVLAVVDALGLDGAAGIGHSLGGATLVLAELARPGTFSGLWCWEPIIPPPDGIGAPGTEPSLADLARRRRNRFTSRQAAVDNYRAKPPFAAFAPGMLEAYVDNAFRPDPGGGVSLVLPGDEEATVYEGAPLHHAWDALGALDLPVVVAGSGDDARPPAAWLGPLAARIPGGRAERFDGLTHFGPLEDPGRVGRAIVADLLAMPAPTPAATGRSTGTVPPSR